MLRGVVALRQLVKAESSLLQPFASQCCAFSSTANPNPYTDVPEGHVNSDLTNFTCHIGLGRRRDLTLRQDLRLWSGEEEKTLADVFKGKKIVLVGMPGGKVCTDKHLPSYLKEAEQLRQKGVDKVVAVLVTDPSTIQNVLPGAPLKQDGQVCVYADRNGGLARLLGVDLGGDDSSPKCQRFAGILEDGILLKLAVEQTPGDLKVTDAKSMMQLWDKVYQKK